MSKISVWPIATEMAAADYFACLMGGADKRITKADALKGATGEDSFMQAASGQTAGVKSFTAASYVTVSETLVDLFCANALNISSQNMQIVSPPGGTGIFMTYVASVGGNWAVAPTDVWTTLDRLGAAVAGLLGVPVP